MWEVHETGAVEEGEALYDLWYDRRIRNYDLLLDECERIIRDDFNEKNPDPLERPTYMMHDSDGVYVVTL